MSATLSMRQHVNVTDTHAAGDSRERRGNTAITDAVITSVELFLMTGYSITDTPYTSSGLFQSNSLKMLMLKVFLRNAPL